MKHSFIIRVSVLLIGLTFLAPVAASAQTATTTDAQSQIQALVTQIKALQEQLKQVVQGQMQNAASTTSAGQSGTDACPNITQRLTVGAHGKDISALQSFLSLDPSIFPEAMTTGYYGRATDRAVKRLLKRFASSTADTTADINAIVQAHCGEIRRFADGLGMMGSSTRPFRGDRMDWTGSTTPLMPQWMGSTTMPYVPQWMSSTTAPMPPGVGRMIDRIVSWMGSTTPGVNGGTQPRAFVQELHSILPGMFNAQQGNGSPSSAQSGNGAAGAQ